MVGIIGKGIVVQFLGDGIYNMHGCFDATNEDRIKLAWTEKEVTAIFTKMEKEYPLAMDLYMISKGGGPKADANFSAWQQCDET